MSTRKRKIKKKYSFVEIWERVKKNTALENFNQLAEIVETSVSNVTKRKSEDNFPIEWAFQIAQKYRLTTEWILTGEGLKDNGASMPKKEATKIRKFDILNEAEEWLTEEVEKNPKNEIWFEVEFEKAFQEFKAWKEEKEGKAEAVGSWPASKVA